MCMITAESAWNPYPLSLAPKSEKYIHVVLYENLSHVLNFETAFSFCLWTCTQPLSYHYLP